jgi:hypothetical protein
MEARLVTSPLSMIRPLRRLCRLRRMLGAGSLVLPLTFALSLSLSAVAAGEARAADPQSEAAGRTALAAERQKLRLDLDRINAEIDALKRSGRGVRNDYRLRGRMADAEALARRLTELDARIGAPERPAGSPDGAPLGAAPRATAADDRPALEAKADILTDQSRRLTGQATQLEGRLGELRSRQELRRRAGQLERDPFSPLEQSKRRLVLGVTVGGGAKIGGANDLAGGGASPPTGAGSGPSPRTATPGAAPPGDTEGQATTGFSNNARAGGTLVAPAPIPVPASADAPGSVASQLRGAVDAATLEEIRKLEAPRSPAASIQAMERALEALRARATQLDTEARALRRRARSN